VKTKTSQILLNKQLVTITDSNGNRIQVDIISNFTNHNFDPVLEIYYAKARFYDPTLKRFHAPDPYKGNVFEPQSLNLYTYVWNNPIRYFDPDGRDKELVMVNGQLHRWTTRDIEGTKYVGIFDLMSAIGFDITQTTTTANDITFTFSGAGILYPVDFTITFNNQQTQAHFTTGTGSYDFSHYMSGSMVNASYFQRLLCSLGIKADIKFGDDIRFDLVANTHFSDGGFHMFIDENGIPSVYPVDTRNVTDVSPENEHGYHAVDIMAPGGTAVYAFRSGKVIGGGIEDDYGETSVIILGDDGYIYFYTHLTYDENNPVPPRNTSVDAGTLIGTVGLSGMGQGPHLHLDISKSQSLGGLYNTRNAMSRTDIVQNYLPDFVSPQQMFRDIWETSE
jgi:RHS repeat-associated protein